jgi:hypothetical protein
MYTITLICYLTQLRQSTSTLDLPRLKIHTHFRSECTRIKRSDGPTPWLTGSSLSTTPPTKLSSPVSLSFKLLLPDANCTCLASYWRNGKIAANQQCWSSTQLTVPHYASPLLLPCTNRAKSSSRLSCRMMLSNSSIVHFFRLTKPPHSRSFQTDFSIIAAPSLVIIRRRQSASMPI